MSKKKRKVGNESWDVEFALDGNELLHEVMSDNPADQGSPIDLLNIVTVNGGEDVLGQRFPPKAIAAALCERWNFLVGVPPGALNKGSDGAKMFLAFLKGDGLAALTYADEVQASANLNDGELFMPRASIEKSNGVLAEAYGNRGVEIRRVYEMLRRFVSGPETNFPTIREAMATLLKELRRNAFL